MQSRQVRKLKHAEKRISDLKCFDFLAVCYPGACSDSVLKSISKDMLKENGAVLKDHWCQSTEMEITPVDYFSL